MENLIVELEQAAERCEKAAAALHRRPLKQMCDELLLAIKQVGEASPCLWDHDKYAVYISRFEAKQPGEVVEDDCFVLGGRWQEYTYQQVQAEILRRAGLTDNTRLAETTKSIGEAFRGTRDDVLSIFEAILAHSNDDRIADLHNEVESCEDCRTHWHFLDAWMPPEKRFTTGEYAPHHIRFRAWLASELSYGEQAEHLARLIRRGATYLRHLVYLKGLANSGSSSMANGSTAAKTDGTIFIGHGRSSIWLQLKEHLKERLGLVPDEFNEECTVGQHPRQRLEVMLDRACFAFLVMTGEDQSADGELHARANVIHEAGLFQGRLGFDRVALLVEDGCRSFSNVEGLTEIRFRKGEIRDAFQQVRDVLEREGILQLA